MRNARGIGMIIVSLLLGVAAMIVAGKWLNERANIEASRIVVAAQDINVGTRLTPDLLTTIDWPSGSVPIGSYNDINLLDGRVNKVNLHRGEPLLEAKLAPEGTAGGLSGVIADGKRAITVRVNDVVGVAGFALPGNLVDILVNIKEDNNKNPISKIVLEQILVLAVAQDLGRDETKPKVVNAVTLEVTPEEAEKLDLARSVGTLSLALRNQIDNSLGVTNGVRTNDLLGRKIVTTEAKPETKIVYKSAGTPKPSVEIIRGLQKTNAHH